MSSDNASTVSNSLFGISVERADKTLLANLYGDAVEAISTGRLSFVSSIYCSYALTATAVCVSQRYPNLSNVFLIVFKVPSSSQQAP